MKSLRLILVAVLLFFVSCEKKIDVKSMSENELKDYAKGIHERVITLDTHNDIDVSNFTEEKNYTMELDNQVNLPKMIKGGLDVSFFIVYTGQGELNDEGYAKAYKNADEKFKAIHRLTEKYASDKIELALTSDDVRRISKAGKKVAMIGVENAYPVGLDLSNIKSFQERGARYMSLAHNGHSQFSDSNTGEKEDDWLHNGLSDLGRQAVAEMNKWGIMVDISHPSKQANIEMMKLSKAPVIASHSSARALCDHSRNLDDEQLELLKKNGGVVQTVAFSSYLHTEKNKAHSEARRELYAEVAKEMGVELKEWSEIRKLSDTEREAYFKTYREIREKAKPMMAEKVNKLAPPVDVKDFVDHIDYLVKKIGLEHVGISSDFDGGGGVDGWNDASETFNVTLELVRRGYSEKEISMLWSGNLLRVLDDVQRIAKELQKES